MHSKLLKKTLCLLGLAMMTIGITCIAEEPVKIGVLAKRGNEVAMKQWGPLADYLTEATGRPFRILPLSFVAIEPAVEKGSIDLLLANSGFFVDLESKHGIRSLATMLNKRQNRSLDQFSGVILVRDGSPIQNVSDLRGKSFMCVKKTSFGGGLMAFRHMIEAGVNPFTDVQLKEGKKHDAVVVSVQKGLVDAGTVRSDTLERMEAEGKIKMEDFQVLDRASDDFPFVHTTMLYPEWPMAALDHVEADLGAEIAEALKNLSSDHPAAKAGKIVGWTDSANYGPVADCLDAVRVAAQ